MRKIRTSIVALLVATLPLAASAQTSKSAAEKSKSVSVKTATDKKVERGSRIFESHCASCHSNGGNSVNPTKPVAGSQVLGTMATFKSYLDQPIGNMPHYEHVISNQKLLDDLYAYTKSLSAKSSPAKADDASKAKKIQKTK